MPLLMLKIMPNFDLECPMTLWPNSWADILAHVTIVFWKAYEDIREDI